jgi:hypothetical protein
MVGTIAAGPLSPADRASLDVTVVDVDVPDGNSTVRAVVLLVHIFLS